MPVLTDIRLEIISEADRPENTGRKKKVLSLSVTNDEGILMKQGITFVENQDTAKDVADKLRFAASTILKQAKMIDGANTHGKEGQSGRSARNGGASKEHAGQVPEDGRGLRKSNHAG